MGRPYNLSEISSEKESGIAPLLETSLSLRTSMHIRYVPLGFFTMMTGLDHFNWMVQKTLPLLVYPPRHTLLRKQPEKLFSVSA